MKGGLSKVRTDLTRGHSVKAKGAIVLLFEQYHKGVVEDVLAPARLKPAAAPAENAEYVPAVFVVASRRIVTNSWGYFGRGVSV